MMKQRNFNFSFYFSWALGLGIFAIPATIKAEELVPGNLTGFVAVETRAFTENPQHTGQDNDNLEMSIALQPEYTYKSEDGKRRASVILFYRQDSHDDERTHFDVREAYISHIGDDWEVLAGVNKVFWGVSESRHLVNIINQVDAVEDIDQEDFLGQPMINLGLQREYGDFNFYVLPGFRERTFPGEDGRFRGPLPVDADDAQYESGAEEKHVDFAARYSHYMDEWDVGASYFYGTSREPDFVVNPTFTAFIPVYELIHQGGLDVQYTKDAWLGKFEGIVRQGQGDTFTAMVGGVEYTFYQIFEKPWDLGVLAEYQYDGRDSDAPPVVQDNDVFGGVRFVMNDSQDTEALIGISVDHETNEVAYNVEAERRIGDHYNVELRGRFFSGSDPGEDVFSLKNDDYVQIRLARYF